MNDSDFKGLNLTNHLSAQESLFCISEIRTTDAVNGFSTMTYMVVSSANRPRLELISDTMSFINTRNNKGPCWFETHYLHSSGS